MIQRIAVVSRSDEDFKVGTQLAERVLRECLEWGTEEPLPVRWITTAPTGERFLWDNIATLVRQHNIIVHPSALQDRSHLERGWRPYGFAEPISHDRALDERGKGEMIRALKAIRLVRALCWDIDAILLLDDMGSFDGTPQGLRQARDFSLRPESVLVGVAIPDIDSWVLSGFEPETAQEQERLEAQHQLLGKDPRTHGYTLGGYKNHRKRNVRRVLDALCPNDSERRQRCWTKTPLSILRQRGAANGLTLFLNEVRQRLAPLLVT